MSENLVIATITAITAVISAGIAASVMWWVAVRKTPKEVKVLNAQETLNFTESFKVYAEALDSVVKTVMATNKELEDRINELEAHRTERSKQLYEIQKELDGIKQANEARDREYVKETQALRDELAKFEKKNNEYREIIKRLIEVLQKVDPKLLDGIDLTDTLEKIKIIK